MRIKKEHERGKSVIPRKIFSLEIFFNALFSVISFFEGFEKRKNKRTFVRRLFPRINLTALVKDVSPIMGRELSVNFLIEEKVDSLSFKTVSANKATVKKEWVVVDASDLVLGRMGSKVAKLLRGKYKPNFTPHVDCGDNVIIINAEKVKLTGNKWDGRVFFRHTGYPGGRRDLTPAELFAKSPEKLVERTVKGMLPKNRLGRQIFKNLHIYVGSEHPHTAQQPKLIDLNTLK